MLAMLVWQRPNLLLLDEPTNHLDLTTREALSMALNEFEGTVMIVSHDRALLREICDEFWLVSGGMLKPFDGDLDDYQTWLLDVVACRSTRPADAAAAVVAGAPSRRRRRRPPHRCAKSAPAAKPPSMAKSPAPPAAGRDDRKAQKQARAKQSDATRPQRAELQRIEARLARLGAPRRPRPKRKLAAPSARRSVDFAELGRRARPRQRRDDRARRALARPPGRAGLNRRDVTNPPDVMD